jgi:CRP-like cAMP-binding protein
MADLRTLLGATPWARRLGAAQFDLALAAVVERRVAAGAYVCRKGEPVDAWIGVLDGLVKMTSVSPAGKAVTFTGLPTGGWFGEGSLIKHPEARRYDVVALRDSRVAFMPRATFMALLDASIAFNRFLLEQINERLGQFIAIVETDRLLEPDARVARSLAQLYNPLLYPGTAAELQLSQEEIGLLSGVSRQRANQALRVLEDAGLLTIEYGGVRVKDIEGLRRFG